MPNQHEEQFTRLNGAGLPDVMLPMEDENPITSLKRMQRHRRWKPSEFLQFPQIDLNFASQQCAKAHFELFHSLRESGKCDGLRYPDPVTLVSYDRYGYGPFGTSRTSAEGTNELVFDMVAMRRHPLTDHLRVMRMELLATPIAGQVGVLVFQFFNGRAREFLAVGYEPDPHVYLWDDNSRGSPVTGDFNARTFVRLFDGFMGAGFVGRHHAITRKEFLVGPLVK